jgi:hypothetical protein
MHYEESRIALRPEGSLITILRHVHDLIAGQYVRYGDWRGFSAIREHTLTSADWRGHFDLVDVLSDVQVDQFPIRRGRDAGQMFAAVDVHENEGNGSSADDGE